MVVNENYCIYQTVKLLNTVLHIMCKIEILIRYVNSVKSCSSFFAQSIFEHHAKKEFFVRVLEKIEIKKKVNPDLKHF